MIAFAQQPIRYRAGYFSEVAARRGVSRLIVEKDFWSCFALRLLFEQPGLREHLVFKGGTSLSKVFGIIQRFSEDLDLSVAPEWLLGKGVDDPEQATSRSERERRNTVLQAVCAAAVESRIRPELERQIASILGVPEDGSGFLSFIDDEGTRSPVLLFRYPTEEKQEAAYIEPRIKLEFGSLAGQRPLGTHPVVPWVAEEFPDLFREPSAMVVALEAERTFWEKATILHAEYHRPGEKPMRVRHSRDCYDLCALAEHEAGRRAIPDHMLRNEVVAFKMRYFHSGWARFDLAKPVSFRIVPPPHRVAALRADYREMLPMFLEKPKPFDELLLELKGIEDAINSGR